MNRDQIYRVDDNETCTTFQYDESLPSLPLPKLEDTMTRYFETLKPFGTDKQLENSQLIIKRFQDGIGKKLQSELEKRALTHRNWLEKWWEEYAYHSLRLPLHPYTVMAMPFLLESAFCPETPEYALKALARVSFHTLEFWDLIRKEKLKPASSHGGKIKYSSTLYKRFYGAARLPGEEMDRVYTQFLPESQGTSPHHGIVLSRGRIFKFDCLNDDGTLLSVQQLLSILEMILARTDIEELGDCVPVLTNDDRTNWAKNRKRLQEISQKNGEHLKAIDGNVLMITLDGHEPKTYSELSLQTITGDFHSKWSDKTSMINWFRNGKIGCVGEHSAYDGTISISYALFILLSLMEYPDPDWNDVKIKCLPYLEEIKFNLDDDIKTEIQRVMADCESRRNDVIVSHHIFDNYGKDFMKTCRIHPDAFIQMVLQLVYYKMHGEFTATYETALMRHYYNGRTETLRACTTESIDFVKSVLNSNSTKKEIFEKFKIAANHHDHLMNEARKGNGIDRHLFGLWCIAYENNIEIPELYSDPLYSKSGGGGNFVLSTSTLGYTISTGFVAPMVMDGYGVFYSITSETISMITTAYRGSNKTSAYKFNKIFCETLLEIKNIIDEVFKGNSKL